MSTQSHVAQAPPSATRLICIGVSALILAMPLEAQEVSGGDAAPASTGEMFDFGLRLLAVGMGAVFVGLLAVYGSMIILKRAIDESARAARRAAASGQPPPPVVTAEMAHAIGLALYMDLRTFDEETAEEITIRKITRPFSPWWNAGKTQIMYDKLGAFRRWGE